MSRREHSESWRRELLQLAGWLGAGLLIGLISGAVTLCLLLALGGYTAIHLRRLDALGGWLARGARLDRTPELGGGWDALVQQIERLRTSADQRKQRLLVLRRSQHEFTDAIPDATLILRDNDEIEWANSAAERLLGIRNPQDLGQRIGNLLRDPSLREYLRRGEFARPFELISPRPEGFELDLRVVEFGDGQRLLTARDVTASHRLQTVRRDFVANVSHELRTPLTVIAGYLEVLEGEDLSPELARGVDSMSRQTTRMTRIVEDLLALSRLEMEQSDPEDDEEIAVAGLARKLAEDAARLSGERGHRIEVQTDDALLLRANPLELGSALSNLVNNAVSHTPNGTAIRVSWETCPGGACFTVRDSGPGIDAEHLPRLTERFYRVDPGRSRASGGTGLGLSIVKHAVMRNGGQLEIDSRPGEGSRFMCRFPAERLLRRNRVAAADDNGAGTRR